MPTLPTCLHSLRSLALALGLAVGVAWASEAPLWFDAGRPRPQAWQAVELLAGAPGHGLVAEDYGVDALGRQVAEAALEPALDDQAQERLAQALSGAMQRYLSDLHQGRLDPRQIGHHFDPPPRDGFDPAARLREGLQAGRLAETVDAAAPRLSQYEALRQALAHMRALGDHPAWLQELPPLPRPARTQPGRPGKLEPGQTWDGMALLAERLRLLGDLAADGPLPAVYEGVWVDAVQRFQERHGLAVDGVVGKDTLAALRVTPGERAQQIALNLERLRWTPLTEAQRMIVVNIPEFVLRAYEIREGRIVIHQTMKIIVGKALDTRTPVFGEEMRSIEFSPYWNVPPSIARSETVPKLRRDPAYLAREEMEFVLADGRIGTEVTPDVLAEVMAGRARIRQRPGPKNALGAVKFSFPNRDNIYLHHTPAAQLFGKGRRDFSHGCVRVERPVELALFALQDMPQWTEQRVREAMAAGRLQTVRLATPVPVLITYGTALVKQGRLHFYPDIYGHDRELVEALRQRKATPARPTAATR
ncbi:MAG: peptidase [Burkholderiales bacterium RIFCSPLOWO2_12_67_14]|nr:MAG: peptidase [Burkholderiales bacterium RIFCSPLOWO2_02_FULL_67_64]OGB51140.1 MAG: peptidase [Burkholderiales bacterium RIFCSPLOWO2_12_67_14]OGB53188.1 MAG: peptidase [Burkholderiales bacterium RIFCSPHIGHO2_12_FULL_67_38]